MDYVSTRNKNYHVSSAEAIAKGLAPDGGLFVPTEIPSVSRDEILKLCEMNYRERAAYIIAKYLTDFTQEEIDSFVNSAYGDNFDDEKIAPLKFVDNNTAFLELWHGPTCAFKDMALQILPYFMTSSLKKCGEDREVCILVATSGDTGKAALEGFADVENTNIIVFYPNDGVSDVQKLQMITQNGNNVFVVAVNGNFDDAQTGVKKIFNNKEFAEKLSSKGYMLSSANSINWGRLLPQIVYYFSAYCEYVNAKRIHFGDFIDFAVPTGNFGNILAGWYAKKMGLPVGKFFCCSNSNNVLEDFLRFGKYDKNRKFFNTISPSMDILVSSNLERLLYMISQDDELVKDYMNQLSESGSYTVNESIKAAIASEFYGAHCADKKTKDTIHDLYSETGYLMDPHTAVAYSVINEYRCMTIKKNPTVIVSTASPYKFCDSVLSALGNESDKPGAELIEELSKTTGIKAPKSFVGLKDKEKRFNLTTDKEEMINVVDNFLK